jgi:hypothetical protein
MGGRLVGRSLNSRSNVSQTYGTSRRNLAGSGTNVTDNPTFAVSATLLHLDTRSRVVLITLRNSLTPSALSIRRFAISSSLTLVTRVVLKSLSRGAASSEHRAGISKRRNLMKLIAVCAVGLIAAHPSSKPNWGRGKAGGERHPCCGLW